MVYKRKTGMDNEALLFLVNSSICSCIKTVKGMNVGIQNLQRTSVHKLSS